MDSLRARLFVVWALSLAAAIAVGLLLLQLRGQSAAARQSRGEAFAQQACERIADRYAYYVADWTGTPASQSSLDAATRRDLGAVVALATSADGVVQAGIWHNGDGIVASLPPADLLSPAERAAIGAAAGQAASAETTQQRALNESGQTVHPARLSAGRPAPGSGGLGAGRLGRGRRH